MIFSLVKTIVIFIIVCEAGGLILYHMINKDGKFGFYEVISLNTARSIIYHRCAWVFVFNIIYWFLKEVQHLNLP